jgi:hypothetical protein
MATAVGVSFTDAIQYFSVSAIASRWQCSTDKVSRMLEKFRGETGFLDLGSGEDVRKHKRKYAIVRIHPTLLAKSRPIAAVAAYENVLHPACVLQQGPKKH